MRIGKVDGEIHLVDGESIIVTTVECISTKEKLYVSYDRLPLDAKPGERILLNDGKSELVIDSIIDAKNLKATIVAGGVLTSNKGFNLPNTKVTIPCLTEKDLIDLEFGLEKNVDWVALSFVRTAEDIIAVKEIIAAKGKHTKVIAKIEKPEAVANIDSIIKVADGIMVARGDLGVEVGSLNYIGQSTHYFVRTKALQSHSFLPEITTETALPIIPNSFVKMNLKQGDLLISKDSNIGEVVILDKDYPNFMLSGAIYKLPVVEKKYYLLALVKMEKLAEW